MFITLAVPSTARMSKTSRSSGQSERDQETRRGDTSMSLNLQPGSILGELGFDYESRHPFGHPNRREVFGHLGLYDRALNQKIELIG